MLDLGVVYSRFSSENQDVKSADDQDIENAEYAKANNIRIIKYFRDEAKSGTKTAGRNGFFEMIDFCKKYNKDSKNIQKIKYILVWKFNRFARNDYDSMYFKKELRRIGIRVISITQKIEDTPEGHMLEKFLQTIDSYYSENMAEDIKRGLRNNAKEYKFNGGTPPLGYKVENKKYVINPAEAVIVRDIFSMYLSGYSLIDIAMEMNSRNALTRFGQPFKASSIFSILGNKKYIGIYEYNMQGQKICGENALPPIISKNDFRRVSEMRENNKKHRGTYSAKEDYLLSGLIICKECGRNYVGQTSTRKKKDSVYKYRKYGCGGRNKLNKCENVYLNADRLEQFVFDILKEKLATPENFEKIYSEINELINKINKQVIDVRTDSKRELTSVSREIQNCLKAITDGYHSEALKQKLEKLEERESYLKSEIANANSYETKLSINKENILKAIQIQFNNFDKFSPEEKKSIFRTYISKIEVDRNNITIYFNLKSIDDFSSSDMEPLVRLERTTY